MALKKEYIEPVEHTKVKVSQFLHNERKRQNIPITKVCKETGLQYATVKSLETGGNYSMTNYLAYLRYIGITMFK